MEEIRKFLFKNMYHNKSILDKLTKASLMIERLFCLYNKDINKAIKIEKTNHGLNLLNAYVLMLLITILTIKLI